MAGTIRVVMHSSTARSHQQIFVATEADWTARQRCAYEPDTDRWVVDLSTENRPAQGIRLKFLCDEVWALPPGSAGDLWVPRERFSDPEYVFPEPVSFPVEGWESGRWGPLGALFRPSHATTKEWDFIVVGSGMGGGVLAHELVTNEAANNASVLVLEAGGYLFPTHLGNLPRPHRLARNDMPKSIWDLYWDYFRVLDYEAVDDPDGRRVDIDNSLAFGGRSLYWGGTAPRLSPEELQRWPAGVRADDLAPWYQRAEGLLRVGDSPESKYQTRVLERLRNEVSALADHDLAPMAVEYTSSRTVPSAVPTGVFSTAALLLEDLLQQRPGREFAVHLDERVTGLEVSGGRVRSVRTHDTHDRDRSIERSYRLAPNGRVILAAGAIGTARLAITAGIAAGPGVGVGLTDHPIHVAKFKIPTHGEFSPVDGSIVDDGRPQSSKTLSRRSGAGFAGGRGYNLLMELGAPFNQSRFGSDVELAAVRADEAAGRGSWCEAVFLLDADLRDANTVTVDGNRTTIDMHRVPTPPDVMSEIVGVTEAIVEAFGGVPVSPGGAVGLTESPLGGVAHHTGTMRMGELADPVTVVDTDLRVRGHANLYVCDLSVFPTSPASNPSLTLTALALRLADTLVD